MSEIRQIEVRGGQVHNLKQVDIDIPLNKLVVVSGLSGSGKSSLAMGILYAEGSRRYLEALSTYTRRRLGQSKTAQVREIRHIPAAIALRQRPGVPSERSTVGSMSELLNIVRLIFSRLGSVVCPNGHRLAPSLDIAQAMDLPDERMGQLTCPTCGVQFAARSAADFSFNAGGACPTCQGTGQVQELDESKLIGDPTLTLDQGAVASWRLPGRNFMPKVAETLGVRLNVPYQDLTAEEKEIVLHGAKKRYPIDLHTNTGRVFHSESTLYENAYEAVYDSMQTSKSESSVKKISRFFHFSVCPTCQGHRFDPQLLTQLVGGQNIVEVSELTLGDLENWVQTTQAQLPANMQTLAKNLFQNLHTTLRPLLELGLDYLTLARRGNTLSTGELQRIQLAKTLRTETTGVLYVLDEPSIGLHPDNVRGLIHILRSLIARGNSLVVVDHEVDLIQAADWVIEVGPGSGAKGGQIIATGTPQDLTHNPQSLIGPFISGQAQIMHPKQAVVGKETDVQTQIQVQQYFNLHDLRVAFPEKQITAVTGFSGAGKTSLILESLVPAVQQAAAQQDLPAQVTQLTTNLRQVVSVDAKPVGKNTRSSVATYTSIMDHLRTLFAALPKAQEQGYGRAYFSYNNKQGACPHCGGLGTIGLDLQYLPDMEVACPVCQGKRFKPEVQQFRWQDYTIIDLLNLSVCAAIPVFQAVPAIVKQLQLLQEVGLDYLHLGESTPALSGGEAQRLKLMRHLNKKQAGTLFVFDEPSVGLHPLDVQTLLGVFNQLKAQGATIIMITHDLDLMANADYLVDLGPRGGSNGGQLLAAGVPQQLVKTEQSLTLDYLKEHYQKFGLLKDE
ncbi:ATP-binding cassette domain-containing protein [Lactobacillus sp. DCY120]|uniref:UvrABC system protein A n=1 Tax=Bombilactobacillus apium TaxID=2675299 RepID=A0A850R7E2_9LACO|nr:AAA family ATPase [Bombilactobacillus apium]NVY96582.1 ATP-binding cassette domain-containing protein [Bombilactobacillus apium]